MEVADYALGAEDFFAIELQDDSQDAVRGGMLRAHVDDELVGIEVRPIGSVEIEMGGAEIGNGIREGFVFYVCHWPLSIPRLICTHSLSCCRMP